MKLKLILLFLLPFSGCMPAVAQTHNSYPSATNVILLRRDNLTETNPNWLGANPPIKLGRSPYTNGGWDSICKIVANCYYPFGVTVTDDTLLYQRTPSTNRGQIWFTFTMAPFGNVAGEAFVGGFGWDAYSQGFIGWNGTSGSPLFAGLGAFHESLHLLGSEHDGWFLATCNKYADYNNGVGSGQKSFVPGCSDNYYDNIQSYTKGSTVHPTCDTTNQDIIDEITRYTPVKLRPDDIGNTPKTAKVLTVGLDSCNIGVRDTDMFKIVSTGIKLMIRPRSAFGDTLHNSIVTINPNLLIYDSTGKWIETDTTINNTLNIYKYLPKGTWYIGIKGGRGFEDYGYSRISNYSSIGGVVIYSKLTGTQPPPVDCSTFKINVSPQNQIICQTKSTQIQASGASSYSWLSSSSILSSLGSMLNISPIASTTYTVTGTNQQGCTATAQATVTVNPLPVIQIQPNNPSKCQTQPITLNASGAQNYTWQPTVGLSSTMLATVICTSSTTTTYTVIGVGSNGCSTSNAFTVNINPNPQISISGNPNLPQGQSTTLTANGGSSYKWNTGATTQNITVSPLVNTSYSVIGTDLNGCTNSATATVTVIPPVSNCNATTLSYPTVSGQFYVFSWVAVSGATYSVCLTQPNGHEQCDAVGGVLFHKVAIKFCPPGSLIRIKTTCSSGVNFSNVIQIK